MKYLRIIDFIGQSLIWLALIGCGLLVVASDRKADVWFLGMACQFALGCWQMVSCLILLILRADLYQLRKIHLIISTADLLMLALVASSDSKTEFINIMIIVTGAVIPWALAIFYSFITWRWMFPKPYTGKFLAHINF